MFNIKKIKINFNLLIIIFLLMIISIITINSSMLYLSSDLGNLASKQILWYVIGLLFMIVIFTISNNEYKYTKLFYFFNVFMLFLLLIFGRSINGSKCWFIIPGIGSIQPSEFMKVSLILSISKITSKWTKNIKKKITFRDEFKLFLKVFIIFLIPTILTFLEPDTGVVLIYMIICFCILFTSPIRKRWFILLLIIGLLFIGTFLFIYFFKQDLFVSLFGTDLFYRIDRLLDWKNGTGMQLENSLTAIGSGGIFGHGYRKTPIYFPESGTDFIFAVFASNFGLIGSIIFIIILLLFDIVLINISKETNNITNKYIICGTLGMITYQEFQNIGMTLGILPITGITLPLISYGGSSLISYLLIIGIVFKISSENKRTIN